VYCATVALRRPASKMVSDAEAPSDQNSAGSENNFARGRLKPAASGEAQRRIVGGLLHSDQRIGLRHGAFRRGDIRAPLQQLRRNADRDGGNRRGQRSSPASKSSKRACRSASRWHARRWRDWWQCRFRLFRVFSVTSACATASGLSMPVSTSARVSSSALIGLDGAVIQNPAAHPARAVRSNTRRDRPAR
jgi:hypothetical protein